MALLHAASISKAIRTTRLRPDPGIIGKSASLVKLTPPGAVARHANELAGM